jgi:hypothetical protein
MKKKTCRLGGVVDTWKRKFDSGAQYVTFFKHNGFRFNERK